MMRPSASLPRSDSACRAATSDPPLLPHRFGSSPPLSIGVEEELLLVGPNRLLAPASEALLQALPPQTRERVAPELFAAQIEVKSGICSEAHEAVLQLSDTRRQIAAAGFGLLGAGLHPRGGFADAPIVSKPRYLAVREDLRGLLRTPPCALHVHVGMPDPETAIQVANALRRHVPVLQALTANSPFWHGMDSGMDSARSAILRSYPRIEMPRAFAGYEDFCATAAELVAAAGVEDYTHIWWDVRPHPRLGTIEVRAMDTQTSVSRSVAVAALIQALAAREMEERRGAPTLSREALDECHHQAARHGLSARVCRSDGSTAPAAEVLGETLQEALPYACALGSEEALQVLQAETSHGNGADEQRRVQASLGMPGLLDHLSRRTEGLI
jgi:carboxylate-amine ligase